MEFPEINYWAVLVSALAVFVIGSIWYSPVLFANAWMKEQGFTREGMAKGSTLKIFGISFLLMLIMAFNLAAFIVNGPGEMAGADYGYVGAGKGKVTLYYEGKAIIKDIPEKDALKELLDLINKTLPDRS